MARGLLQGGPGGTAGAGAAPRSRRYSAGRAVRPGGIGSPGSAGTGNPASGVGLMAKHGDNLTTIPVEERPEAEPIVGAQALVTEIAPSPHRRMDHTDRGIALALAIFSFSIVLSLLKHGVHVTQEDGFYYFKNAQQIASGAGSTFDG